jgi:outer membrane protein assembly factor BamB
MIFAFAVATPADDWTRWRGPSADSISAEKGWNASAVGSPKVVWRTNVGAGHSCATVKGDVLYIMGNIDNQDVVQCRKIADGKTAWEFKYSCSKGNYAGPRASVVLDNGSAYTFSRNGDLHCLDAKTGAKKWHVNVLKQFSGKNITWGLASSPVIEGDMVLVNACKHGVALNKSTGAKIWASPSDKCGYASPVVFESGGKKLVAIFGAKGLYCVDLASGKQLWFQEWVTKYDVNAADPVPMDGKIFISSAYNRGCTMLDISGSRPRKLWENKTMANHFASSILINGHLYGVHGNTGGGQLRCIDVKSGKMKWSQGGGFENLMAADGKLIAIDKSGVLTIAEAVPTGFKKIAAGKVLDKSHKKWTMPVLANGRIYCRNSNGDLVCISVGK